MSAPATADVAWSLPSKGRVAMFSLIGGEATIFVIFVVAYLFYLGKSPSGPTPAVLHAPLFLSVCLIGSSWTIHRAVNALKRGAVHSFSRWWLATLALGVVFLAGTGLEWRHLIVDEGLTISTNLFGTTYYSLVGLHAFHLIAGIVALGTVSVFALFGKIKQEHARRADVISLYWHFVDVVWVAVFLVVYVIGR